MWCFSGFLGFFVKTKCTADLSFALAPGAQVGLDIDTDDDFTIKQLSGDSDEPYQIFVNGQSTMVIEVNGDNTIANVKGQIQHKVGTRPSLQTLVFNRQQLRDEATLS